jgi:hypothetical protein
MNVTTTQKHLFFLMYPKVSSRFFENSFSIWLSLVTCLWVAHPLKWGVLSKHAASWMLSAYGEGPPCVQSPLFSLLIQVFAHFFSLTGLEFFLSGFSFAGVLLALGGMAFQAKGRLLPIFLLHLWCLFGFTPEVHCAPGSVGLWLAWVAWMPYFRQRLVFYGVGVLLDPWQCVRYLGVYGFSLKSLGLCMIPFFSMQRFSSFDFSLWQSFFDWGDVSVAHVFPLPLLLGFLLFLLYFLSPQVWPEVALSVFSIGGVLASGMPLEGALLWVFLPFFCRAREPLLKVPLWLRCLSLPAILVLWFCREPVLEIDPTWMLSGLPSGSVLWVQTPSVVQRLRWAQFQGLRGDVNLLDLRSAGSPLFVKKGVWAFLEGKTEKFRRASKLLPGVLPWSELSILLPEGGSFAFQDWQHLVWRWIQSPEFECGARAPPGTKATLHWQSKLERLDEILGAWLETFPQQLEVYLAAERLVQFLEQFKGTAPLSFKKHAFQVRATLKTWFPDNRRLHLALKREATQLLSSRDTSSLFGPKEEKHLMDQFSLTDGPQRRRTP